MRLPAKLGNPAILPFGTTNLPESNQLAGLCSWIEGSPKIEVIYFGINFLGFHHAESMSLLWGREKVTVEVLPRPI
jgi:hypothetical protein